MEKVKIGDRKFMEFRNIFDKIEYDLKQRNLKKKGEAYWAEDKNGTYKRFPAKRTNKAKTKKSNMKKR